MHDESLGKLDKWVRENGWSGYDPYDIKGAQPFLMLSKMKATDFAASKAVGRFPMASRRFFKVEKQINSKAMGLFSRAYVRLHKKRPGGDYGIQATECLNWLKQNFSPGYAGKCWGYPFNWQSRVLIPKGTPSVVVSSIAAHAFMDAYEAFGEKEYLDIARSTCDFIINDLNRDEDDDGLCFSYTPLDNFHVHNANLFGASLLARVGRQSGENELKKLALKSMAFTMKHQNHDGSFFYWAPPDHMFRIADNYHTGFVLEALNVCRRALGEDFRYEKELKKGLDFYARELFTGSGESKMTASEKYPINIHSCAQGIITFQELADYDKVNIKISEKVAEWTIKHMQDPTGYFYHQINRKGYVDRTPYIRWGQAWMILALSYLAEDKNETGF